MKNVVKVTLHALLLGSLLLAHSAHADIDYDALFPDAVTSHQAGVANFNGRIEIKGGDGRLNFSSISDNARSCDNDTCERANGPAGSLSLPRYQTATGNRNLEHRGGNLLFWPTLDLQSDYNNITLRGWSFARIRPQHAVTRIRNMHIHKNAYVDFAPGVYFIENLDIQGNVTLSSANRPVTIIARNLHIKDGDVNRLGSHPERLAIVTYESAILENTASRFWLYSKNNTDIGGNVDVIGGISSGNINMSGNTNIRFRGDESGDIKRLDTFAYFDNGPELMSYWDMNDVDSTSAFDARSNKRESIIANHFEMLGGATTHRRGKFCEALYLNGVGAHVNAPHNVAYERDEGSIALWVKMPNLSHSYQSAYGGQAFFSKESNNRDNGGHLTMWAMPDGSVHTRFQSITQSFWILTDDQLIQPNQWFHLTITWQDDVMKQYFNGEFVGQITGIEDIAGLTRNPEPIVLGGNGWWSSDSATYPNELKDFFKGFIDEVRIYNRALTQQQVVDLKVSTPSCEPYDNRGLVAEYRFAEETMSGSRPIKDSSGNGRHATVSGEVRLMTPANNMSCGLLDVPPNTNLQTPDYLETAVDIDRDVGQEGTISFWFKSNSGWQDERDRTLFDAGKITQHTASHGDNKFFFLRLNQNGSLEMSYENQTHDRNTRFVSPQYSFAEPVWKHIAVTWNYHNRSATLFIDGVEQPFTIRPEDLLHPAWDNTMPDFDYLAIGDNKTSYFAPSLSANGRFDEVRIYNYEQDAGQVQKDMLSAEPCSLFTGFKIEHADQVLTCDSTDINIKACANDACDEYYDEEPIEVLFSQNSTALGSSSATSDQSESITFTRETTIRLSRSTPEVVNFSVTPSDATFRDQMSNQCTGNCNIEFVSAGLQIYHNSPAAFYDGNPLAFSNSVQVDKTAGSPMNDMFVRAVRDNNGVCETFLAGPQTLNVDYTCGTEIDGAIQEGCKVPLHGSLNGSGVQNTNLPITFNNNGVANLADYTMRDAVNMVMRASLTVDGVTMQSNRVQVDWHPQTIGLLTNLTTDPIAGEPFAIAISATGVGGIVLPSYQYEQLQFNARQVIPQTTLNFGTLLLGNGVNISTNPLINLNSLRSLLMRSVFDFDNGQLDLDEVVYTDAGVIEIDMVDTRGDTIVQSNTLRIGPFIPAFFDITPNHVPRLENTNFNFTYIGQAFTFETANYPSLRLIPKNSLGQTVYNYINEWSLFPTVADLNNHLGFNDTNTALVPMLAGGTMAPEMSIAAPGSGYVDMDFKNLNLQFTKTAVPNNAFNSNMSMTIGAGMLEDDKGVCYRPNYPTGGCESYSLHNINNARHLYGRLFIDNVYGPETMALRMPLSAQFFANGMWITNTDDSFTDITIAQTLGQIELTNLPDSTHNLVASYATLNSTGSLNNGVSDATDLVFAPATLPTAMQVTLRPDVLNPVWARYLNYDWNNDGVINANDRPTATINFGLFRGNDRSINFREVMP